MTSLGRVISWDWKDQADMAAVAAAVTELSAIGQVFMREIDTGGDCYAWVLSNTELTEQQASDEYFDDE